MKRCMLLAAAIVLLAGPLNAQVPTLKQARQRAGYQIAQIQNGIGADSAALEHAHRLWSMLDSMVVQDSIQSLVMAGAYDSISAGFLQPPQVSTIYWQDVHFGGDVTLTAEGQGVQLCAYGWVAGEIRSKNSTRCPDPPAATAPVYVDASMNQSIHLINGEP